MQDPKSAALVFESGRVVFTGLHRHEDTPAALQNLLNNLKEAGITCLDKPEVAITNIVCSCDLGYRSTWAELW
jgi:transcription initiation factor TFIID TATA-box-binding protein